MSGAHTPEQVCRFECELAKNPALVERILQSLPPAPAQPERIIRCSRENVDLAICRALARVVVNAQPWRIEITNL
jgi:hypothetical protein